MDFTIMSDDEVLALRNEVNTEAEKRLAAMTIRNDAVDLMSKAKDVGRSEEEVTAIFEEVRGQVFAAPEEVT